MIRYTPAMSGNNGITASRNGAVVAPERHRSAWAVSVLLHAGLLALLLLTPPSSPFPASGDPEIEIDLEAQMPVAPAIDSAQSESVKPGTPAPAAVQTPPPAMKPAEPPRPAPAPKPVPVAKPVPPTPVPTPVKTPPLPTLPNALPNDLPAEDDGELPPPPVMPVVKPKPTPPLPPTPVKPAPPVPPQPKPLPQVVKTVPAVKPEVKPVAKPEVKPEAKPEKAPEKTSVKSLESVLKNIPDAPAAPAAKSLESVLKNIPAAAGKPHAAKSLDDILSGAQEDATGGAPGKASTRTAGRKRGGGTPLSGSDLDGLSRQIRENWDLPIESDASAVVSFQLSQDGRIVGEAAGIHKVSGEDDAFRRARRALLLSQPFRLPPEKYETWQQMTVRFSAQGVRF